VLPAKASNTCQTACYALLGGNYGIIPSAPTVARLLVSCLAEYPLTMCASVACQWLMTFLNSTQGGKAAAETILDMRATGDYSKQSTKEYERRWIQEFGHDFHMVRTQLSPQCAKHSHALRSSKLPCEHGFSRSHNLQCLAAALYQLG